MAWRNGRRYRDGLEPILLPKGSAVPSSEVVLVTGGSGGLGLALAMHLADDKDSSIVLCGRRPSLDVELPEGVTYRQADVSDASAILAVCSEIIEQHGRLDRVYHLPLVLRDARPGK